MALDTATKRAAALLEPGQLLYPPSDPFTDEALGVGLEFYPEAFTPAPVETGGGGSLGWFEDWIGEGRERRRRARGDDQVRAPEAEPARVDEDEEAILAVLYALAQR